MFEEDEFVYLSALQHYVFCPRQFALIHIEQEWIENKFTFQGRLMHQRVHEENYRRIGNKVEARGLYVSSKKHGLYGKTDMVEFHQTTENGVMIPFQKGLWVPFPVEYKKGKIDKIHNADDIQLCAQAMCLEEMLNYKINNGALFYGKTERRKTVKFTTELRERVTSTANNIRELIRKGKTPAPNYDKRCFQCSFFSVCMPNKMDNKKVKRYLQNIFL